MESNNIYFCSSTDQIKVCMFFYESHLISFDIQTNTHILCFCFHKNWVYHVCSCKQKYNLQAKCYDYIIVIVFLFNWDLLSLF